jgi:TPR repeat protein
VKNELEAAKWYHKAAAQGDEYAQTNLGACYYDGRGVAKKDPVLGYVWTGLAAESGNAQAKKNLASFISQMTPAQLAEAKRIGREWKDKKDPFVGIHVKDPFAEP